MNKKKKVLYITFTNCCAADLQIKMKDMVNIEFTGTKLKNALESIKDMKFMCIDKYFCDYKYYDLICIDEVYFMPIRYLYILAQTDNKLLGCGDPFQLSFDMFRSEGKIKKVYWDLMNQVFPNFKMLTDNKRSDQKLVKEGNPTSPSLKNVKRISIGKTIHPDFVHITYTNKTRKRILEKYVNMGYDKLDNAPYMCTKNIKSQNLYNGLIKTYKELNKNTKHFVLAYATTVYKAQGKTIHKKMVIHDLKFMEKEENIDMLYTAMRRVTKFDLLHIIKRDTLRSPSARLRFSRSSTK